MFSKGDFNRRHMLLVGLVIGLLLGSAVALKGDQTISDNLIVNGFLSINRPPSEGGANAGYLNLGNSADNTAWHLTYRVGDFQKLQLYYYDGTTYQGPFLSVYPGDGLAVFDGPVNVHKSLAVETLTVRTLAGPTAARVCRTFPGELASCSSGAEYVPTLDDGNGLPEAGDLVSVIPVVQNPYGDEHAPFVVAKSSKAYDANLMGFILNPELGADGVKLNDKYLPLAVSGYFPVKVTMENGPIKRGDAITSSSRPGYGMKATKAGKIIGYALGDADIDGIIQVFTLPGGGYYIPQQLLDRLNQLGD